jgi:O-antigen/teichoic acid export membrane protein
MVFKFLGIDKAIFYTSSSSIIGAFGNIASAILVIKFLTINEQGFYYTFGSLVAIQIFFELGLNGIITQFVAHENAQLKWDNDKLMIGNDQNKSRLASLLHFCVKWYLFFSFLLIVALILSGVYFFTKYQQVNYNVQWQAPWVLLSIGTALNLLISPVIAFLQGLGKVKEIANFQMYGQITRLSIIYVTLIFGLKLYVLGIGSFTLFILMLVLVLNSFKLQLLTIWKVKIIERVNYFNEIFPYQWKIALSWISGYFIFQIFNPVLFASEGAKVAGQMGLTLAALNGILSLSLSWMTTKVPLFSTLIANKKYDELDTIFNTSLKQSLFINALLLLTFLSLIISLKYFNVKIGELQLSERFISFIPMILMIFTIFINQIVSSWATYLRCHKKEPYLLNSIVGGVLSGISTLYFGKHFGLMGITLGYFTINLLMVPWAYYIYINKRAKWHV